MGTPRPGSKEARTEGAAAHAFKEEQVKTRIIEASDGRAYGKFMIGVFDTEWKRRSLIAQESGLREISLLRQEGWGPEHILVVDLSRPGNGSIFSPRPNGLPASDIAKRELEVCWLFEAFLGWLYQQDLKNLDALPELVHLEEVHEEVPQ